MATNGHDKPIKPMSYGTAKGNAKAIKFVLDGAEVEAQPGETLWQVASRLGTEIPHLCYAPEPGIAAPAWWRSKASACSPRAASVRPRPA